MRNRNKIRSFWKQNIKENSRFQLRSIDRDVFNFLKSISFFPTEFDYFDSVQTIDRSNERRTTAVRRLAQHCFCALGNCIYFILLSERSKDRFKLFAPAHSQSSDISIVQIHICHNTCFFRGSQQ